MKTERFTALGGPVVSTGNFPGLTMAEAPGHPVLYHEQANGMQKYAHAFNFGSALEDLSELLGPLGRGH
jgi:hypothetical protein